VSHPHAPRSPFRLLAQLALAAAALATAWRVAQLASDHERELTPAGTRDRGSAGGFATALPSSLYAPVSTPRKAGGCRNGARPNDELAELYKACPLAAVIDWQTVANSPQQAEAMLPPYHETAERVQKSPAVTSAAAPLEPAVPRIRYPVSVSQNPRIARAEKPSPKPSQEARGQGGEWLIDPKEWFTPAEKPAGEERSPSETQSTHPTTDSHSTEPASSASQSPPTEPATKEQLFAPPAHPAPSIEHPASNIPHPSPESPIFAAPTEPGQADPHLALFTKNAYPSARECAVCHEDIYHEWSMSAHAYAAVSPMFNKFEQRLNDLSQGTVGYFCMRCHAPVATALCASRDEPLWNLPEAARDGITCVACHRVQFAYGKSNGERRIEPGDIFAPVFGGIGGDGVAQTIARKDEYKVKTAPNEPGPGQNIHIAGVYFQPLTRSEFCTPCHQVAVYPGIKLEVVWEQYRASPACKKGIQCQDCHMGRVPGLPLGCDCGPVAKVNGKTVNDNRKRSNHIFYGPNYSIAHPGVFPFHLKANRWTMEQWLTFDWRAGWGTKEFEQKIADGQLKVAFPPVWAEADDRCDAREIIDDNLKKLNRKRELRVQVMENGSRVEGPFFDSAPCRGQDVHFNYVVTNTNEGHNLLTASLGAQPQLWGNVVLIGPDGRRLWESGYTDSCGDLANIHSYDVRQGTLPYDWQLFNLQTMFLITGAKGTDREFYVPVNLDIDQLPFIRPGAQPISTINHPPFIRMESQSLAPLGSRRVPYRIPGHLIQQPGMYRLSFRLRSRSEPIYFMRFCGATEEMERSMNEWMIDVHPMSAEFEVR
jgi:Cytochrome c554 and c-prime